jgi:hypothetical protein
MKIETNVGTADSNIRLFAGVIAIILAFLTGGVVQWFFILAGAFLVATSIMHFCPVYMGMNKSTKEKGG